MEIAIIGAGNVGSALAGAAVKAGHEVRVSASEPGSAEETAQKTGAAAAASNREAVGGAEVVVLAVPYQVVGEVVAELGDALDGLVVVDATNRMDPDDPGRTLDGTSASEQIQASAPGARVVKAFNTIFASQQADPEVEGMQVDGLVAGDDEVAKKTVVELVRSLGLRPLDAGPLAMARALEAMAALNITLNMRNGWSWQTTWKLIGPTD